MARRPRLDENTAGEPPIFAAEPVPLEVTSGETRPCPEESTDTEMDDARSEHAARQVRLARVERMVLQLHSTSETELFAVLHGDPTGNPKTGHAGRGLGEPWRKNEKHFDPKMVTLSKQEKLTKFEKLKVCEGCTGRGVQK